MITSNEMDGLTVFVKAHGIEKVLIALRVICMRVGDHAAGDVIEKAVVQILNQK